MTSGKSYQVVLSNNNATVKFKMGKTVGRETFKGPPAPVENRKVEAGFTEKGTLLLRRRDYGGGTDVYTQFADLPSLCTALDQSKPEEKALFDKLQVEINTVPPTEL